MENPFLSGFLSPPRERIEVRGTIPLQDRHER